MWELGTVSSSSSTPVASLMVSQIVPNWSTSNTVYPGSSDPPEKIYNIFASENEDCTINNYYNTLE